MSRLTASEVIAQGEYLDADFEPSTLTVSQLLGVLGYHNINYPTPYSKPKLVQVFNEQIKPRAAKFRKERVKRENVAPSGDGIRDGLTGEYISAPIQPPPRRSSRRSSRAPSEDIQPIDYASNSKRRRRSVQPSTGEPSDREDFVSRQPIVPEESEPEEEVPIVKKRSKKRDGTDRASKPRKSHNEDSGWEDNNIFQSGAESSSPVRAPSKPRRSSAAPQKPRYSAPLLSPPASPSPFHSKQIPRDTSIDLADSFPSVKRSSSPQNPQWLRVKAQSPLPESPDRLDDDNPDPYLDQEAGNEPDAEADEPELASETGSEISSGEVDPSPLDLTLPKNSDSRFWVVTQRMFYTLLFLAAANLLWEYKGTSAQIGYCDPGRNSNKILEHLRDTRPSIETCHNTNLSEMVSGDLSACLSSKMFIPPPDSCTPCPAHASCDGRAISCDSGFILSPHTIFLNLPPVSDRTNATLASPPIEGIWKVISIMLDGMPGLGSVAFPPECIRDPERQKKIGALGKGISAVLAQERGKRLCNGLTAQNLFTDKEGGEARQWGFDLEELKKSMKQDAATRLWPTFEDNFNDAIKELVQYGDIVIGEDVKGRRYATHRVPSMSLQCKTTVKARDMWSHWRGTVIGSIITFLAAILAHRRRTSTAAKNKVVAGLVKLALQRIQDQEFAHHVDSVITPQPYVSSIQLRDSLLEEEHSLSARKALWSKVEEVVESNTNVRANLEEVDGGDELRVWRWVGGSDRRIAYE